MEAHRLQLHLVKGKGQQRQMPTQINLLARLARMIRLAAHQKMEVRQHLARLREVLHQMATVARPPIH